MMLRRKIISWNVLISLFLFVILFLLDRDVILVRAYQTRDWIKEVEKQGDRLLSLKPNSDFTLDLFQRARNLVGIVGGSLMLRDGKLTVEEQRRIFEETALSSEFGEYVDADARSFSVLIHFLINQLEFELVRAAVSEVSIQNAVLDDMFFWDKVSTIEPDLEAMELVITGANPSDMSVCHSPGTLAYRLIDNLKLDHLPLVLQLSDPYLFQRNCQLIFHWRSMLVHLGHERRQLFQYTPTHLANREAHPRSWLLDTVLIVYIHPKNSRTAIDSLDLKPVFANGRQANIILVVKTAHLVYWLRRRFPEVMEVVWEPDLNMDFRDLDMWLTQPREVDWICTHAVTCYRWYLPAHFNGVGKLSGNPPLTDGELLPGCYVKLPEGCGEAQVASAVELSQPLPAPDDKAWLRDFIGERRHNGLYDQYMCQVYRGPMFDEWCGVPIGSTEMAWVSPEDNPDLMDWQQTNEDTRSHVTIDLPKLNPNGNLKDNDFLEVEPERLGFTWDVNAGFDIFVNHLKSKEAVKKPGKYLVFGCHQGAYACGGHADRLNGIIAMFVMSVLTGREFYIDMPDPVPLEHFLVPSEYMDWRLSDEMRRQLNLMGRKALLLWKYEHAEGGGSFRDLLLSDEDVLYVYTNKKSLLGNMFRFAQFELNTDLKWLRLPYFSNHVFKYLFRPSRHLLSRYYSFMTEHNLDLNAPYIGIHFRAGDARAGFGLVNDEYDSRQDVDSMFRMLHCAGELEHILQFGQEVKWFVATDDYNMLNMERLQALKDDDKLIFQSNSTMRTHISNTHTNGMSKAEQIAGISDSWLDFFILSNAVAIIPSSSGFGLVAAQIGAVPYVFAPYACVRLDLQG